VCFIKVKNNSSTNSNYTHTNCWE